nr:MAG: wsv303-like protein [Metapenaeopsis lamellata majanivirus]
MNKSLQKAANNKYTRDNLCIEITLDFGKNKQNYNINQPKQKRCHLIDKSKIVKSLNETSQKQFTAIRLREEFPPCSILIFSIGSVIIVGLKKLGLTSLGVLQAASAIADTQEYPITISNVEIVNNVSTFSLFKINFLLLQEFFKKNMIAFTYVPESFPGLFFKVLVPMRHLQKGDTIGRYYTRAANEREIDDKDVIINNFRCKTVLIFQVGKCTILGASGRDDIQIIFKMLFGFFWYFIDRSVHVSEKELEEQRKRYHIPPLSWYLMTDFFLRTVPGCKLKPDNVLPNIIIQKDNNQCTSNKNLNDLKDNVHRLNFFNNCILKKIGSQDQHKKWLLCSLLPNRNHQFCQKKNKFEEKLSKELKTIYQNDLQHNVILEQRLKNLFNKAESCNIPEDCSLSLILRYIFNNYEKYLMMEKINKRIFMKANLKWKQIQHNRSVSLIGSRNKKTLEDRKKHKLNIQRLDQFEHIYDIVKNIINKKENIDDIAAFLKIDSHIFSSYFERDNNNNNNQFDFNRPNNELYTYMTPAQEFFNGNGQYSVYTETHENKKGILDFMINEEMSDSIKNNITNVNINNIGTKVYLDIKAIETFLDEQIHHGVINAPLSNYRTQHHQSSQTRIILEDFKTKTLNCNFPNKDINNKKNIINTEMDKSCVKDSQKECCGCTILR